MERENKWFFFRHGDGPIIQAHELYVPIIQAHELFRQWQTNDVVAKWVEFNW